MNRQIFCQQGGVDFIVGVAIHGLPIRHNEQGSEQCRQGKPETRGKMMPPAMMTQMAVIGIRAGPCQTERMTWFGMKLQCPLARRLQAQQYGSIQLVRTKIQML